MVQVQSAEASFLGVAWRTWLWTIHLRPSQVSTRALPSDSSTIRAVTPWSNLSSGWTTLAIEGPGFNVMHRWSCWYNAAHLVLLCRAPHRRGHLARSPQAGHAQDRLRSHQFVSRVAVVWTGRLGLVVAWSVRQMKRNRTAFVLAASMRAPGARP